MFIHINIKVMVTKICEKEDKSRDKPLLSWASVPQHNDY